MIYKALVTIKEEENIFAFITVGEILKVEYINMQGMIKFVGKNKLMSPDLLPGNFLEKKQRHG